MTIDKNKEKLIQTFINKFNDAIELPDWNIISLMDCGKMRFQNGLIISFNKDNTEKYILSEEETQEIKNRISDISNTERFKNNVAKYEAFEIRRNEIGVTDKLIDKLYLQGYELLSPNLKENNTIVIKGTGSRYNIAKKIVNYIDKGQLDLNNIRFSISLDMIALLN
jgi:hypothetical protein